MNRTLLPDSAAWRAGQLAERERILRLLLHMVEQLCLPGAAYSVAQRTLLQQFLRTLAAAIREAP